MTDRGLLCLVANHSGVAVVFDRESPLGRSLYSREEYSLTTSDSAIAELKAQGYRVLEQRLPRRSYVVIHDQGSTR